MTTREETFFNFFCLCLNCFGKWIGTVSNETSIFDLECPDCSSQDSFASLIPEEYTEAFEHLKKPKPSIN